MSFYRQNIIAFIHILEQHNDLFSSYKDAFNNLLENLPEDAEEISKAISKWCEEHTEINKIRNNAIKRLDTRGAFSGYPPPPDPAPNPAENKKLREKLINTIRRFTSPSQSQDKSDEYTKKKSD